MANNDTGAGSQSAEKKVVAAETSGEKAKADKDNNKKPQMAAGYVAPAEGNSRSCSSTCTNGACMRECKICKEGICTISKENIVLKKKKRRRRQRRRRI
jgi:hypothetical protein